MRSDMEKIFIFLISTPVLFITAINAQEDCTPLFFTPAWQECFSRNLQQQLQKSFELAQPRMPAFPPGENGYSQSWSSSSHSGNSVSSSVMSNNGRTWIVKSEGLSMSSSTSSGADRTVGHVKCFIGSPSEVKKSYNEPENSLKIDLNYPNGNTRWISIKLDSPTKINELKVEQRENMMYIEGPL